MALQMSVVLKVRRLEHLLADLTELQKVSMSEMPKEMRLVHSSVD